MVYPEKRNVKRLSASATNTTFCHAPYLNHITLEKWFQLEHSYLCYKALIKVKLLTNMLHTIKKYGHDLAPLYLVLHMQRCLLFLEFIRCKQDNNHNKKSNLHSA